MKQHFTQLDLVKFIYRETDALNHLQMMEAIYNDADLLEQYEELQAGYNSLENSMLTPKRSSIENILKYSRHSVTV